MLQTLIDGLLQGAVLSLAAAGFSLVFGVMHVVNLSHGVIVIIGAYLGWFAWQVLGIDPLVALPGVALVLFAFGYGMQRVIIQTAIQRASLMATLIVTMGVALVLRNLLTLIFTSDVHSIRPAYALAHWNFGTITVDLLHLIAFGASLVLLGLLHVLLNRTGFGRLIRATAQQGLAAQLCGVRVEHVFGLTFGLAAAFAGASGVIVGMLFPFGPASGEYWTIYGFVVVVLGGIGSPSGALVGGLVLGLVETFTTKLIGPAFPNAMAFVVLVLMLVLRPNGLLGNAFGASR